MQLRQRGYMHQWFLKMEWKVTHLFVRQSILCYVAARSWTHGPHGLLLDVLALAGPGLVTLPHGKPTSYNSDVRQSCICPLVSHSAGVIMFELKNSSSRQEDLSSKWPTTADVAQSKSRLFQPFASINNQTTFAQFALANLATSRTFLTGSPHATASIRCVGGA